MKVTNVSTKLPGRRDLLPPETGCARRCSLVVRSGAYSRVRSAACGSAPDKRSRFEQRGDVDALHQPSLDDQAADILARGERAGGVDAPVCRRGNLKLTP
jgi:hypothetical protein